MSETSSIVRGSGGSSNGHLERSVRLRWTAAGVIFGATFPILGWLVAGGAAIGHREQPVLYIVDLAPFVLGFTGFAIGAFHARLIRIRQSIEETVRTRTAELEQALSDLSLTQAELLSAQKLEAIGGLAAGIAHEINTPIQYVGDNTRFIEDSMAGLLAVAEAAGALVASVQDVEQIAGPVARLRQATEDVDIGFLADEVPAALTDSRNGIDQVAQIVRALKSFAHPGAAEKSPTDINELIETTVAVSRSEWKHVADVDLDGLDRGLAQVPVLAGPLKQVLLNLIVNAAHAIEERKETGEMGSITVTTSAVAGRAVLTLADTGGGMPEEIRDRVWEPFFTTKEVGRGSGQGLAIARSIIHKHGGSIEFDTEPGVGTTFTIRLPITDAAPAVEPAA